MLQTVIRWTNVVTFLYLAQLAYTCPCEFIFECHLGEYWAAYLGVGLLNLLNFGWNLGLSSLQ